MRQVFIVATLAACSLAGEEFEEIKAALTDIAQSDCPECVISQAAEAKQSELEREAEGLVRDLKCWWQERNGGVSDCGTMEEPAVMRRKL